MFADITKLKEAVAPIAAIAAATLFGSAAKGEAVVNDVDVWKTNTS